MTEQEREIATIKERTLKLKLSDADCERIAKQAGRHGLTVAKLLENFIGDLVGGTYSNGSDERDFADRWFERCWFGMFPENTLLRHLLECGYEPEEYLELMENIADAEADRKRAEEHPEDYDEEELSFLDDDIEIWEEKLKDMREDWKPKKEPNMTEEIETLKKWVQEVKELKGENHVYKFKPQKEDKT